MSDNPLHIYDGDGPCCSLSEHLARLGEDRPYVLGRLLAVIVENLQFSGHRVTDDQLQECGVLDGDEWTGEYKDG